MAVARRDEKRAGKPKAINCKFFHLWTAGQETKDMCTTQVYTAHSPVCSCVQIFIFMHHRRRVCVHICVSLFREMCVSPQQHHVQCTCVPWYGMCTFCCCMHADHRYLTCGNREMFLMLCFVVVTLSPFSTHISTTTTALQR